jgi:hypothetical protein
MKPPLSMSSRTTTLGQVADIFLGVNLSRVPRLGSRRRVAILQVKDVTDGLVERRADLHEVDFDDDPKHDRALLRPGDVIVTARGTLLKSALVTETHAGVLPTSNLIVVRPTPSVILPELVLAVLRHPRTQAALANEVMGAAVPTLRVPSVARVRLVIPALDQQRDLARLTALGEAQYEAAVQAARLRRKLASEIVMQKLEPTS